MVVVELRKLSHPKTIKTEIYFDIQMYLKDIRISVWTFGTNSVDSRTRTCICSAGFEPYYSDIFISFHCASKKRQDLGLFMNYCGLRNKEETISDKIVNFYTAILFSLMPFTGPDSINKKNIFVIECWMTE